MGEEVVQGQDYIKKAYVIGAGFSAAFGFPLVRDVFKEVEAFCREGVGAGQRHWTLPDRLRAFCDTFSPGLASDDAVTLCDLLESAADMEGAVFAVAEFNPRLILAHMRETLSQIFHQKLQAAVAGGRDIGGKFFAEHGACLFVSFNWDNVLERGLYESKTRIWFSHKGDSKQHALVLKPHGSVDWVYRWKGDKWFTDKYWPLGSLLSKEDGKRSGPHEIVSPYAEVCRLKSIENPTLAWETIRDKPEIPQMITMGHGKGKTIAREAYERIWERWEQADRFLSRAHKIVIIGYSMPPDDVEARLLLRSAIWQHKKQFGHEPTVKVIDPCEKTIDRIEATLGVSVERVPRKFHPNDASQWE